ncbi:MAG: YezD family protein [Nibricoccus sp.]
MPANDSLVLHPEANLDWLEVVRLKVESLRYGVVQIVVHDQVVTQIEKTEKTRLGSPKTNPLA